jgi:hypothetical protein
MTFELFNYPRTITHTKVTPSYTNQTTGAWIPEITTTAALSAHISDLTLEERKYMDAGLLAKGVRKLTCNASAGVMTGDRITITEEDSTTSTWLVNSKMNESNLMKTYLNVSRITYLLEKR